MQPTYLRRVYEFRFGEGDNVTNRPIAVTNRILFDANGLPRRDYPPTSGAKDGFLPSRSGR
jgi:hypothetical protein